MAPNASPALVSLRKRFVWLLAGVVGLFAAGMALSLLFSLRTNNAAELHLLKVEAAQAHTSVMRRGVITAKWPTTWQAIRSCSI